VSNGKNKTLDLWYFYPFCFIEHRNRLWSGPKGRGKDGAPPQTMRSAGFPKDETEGGLFFRLFLLAEQKKWTRSPPPGNKKNNLCK